MRKIMTLFVLIITFAASAEEYTLLFEGSDSLKKIDAEQNSIAIHKDLLVVVDGKSDEESALLYRVYRKQVDGTYKKLNTSNFLYCNTTDISLRKSGIDFVHPSCDSKIIEFRICPTYPHCLVSEQ